jgi:hypothetical protein
MSMPILICTLPVALSMSPTTGKTPFNLPTIDDDDANEVAVLAVLGVMELAVVVSESVTCQ